MTRLIIVRHGESESNLRHHIAGHTDMKLTALGLKQAEVTAAHLADEPIAAVYSSDLSRAMQTALPHAERRGLKVIPEPAFREAFCGEWEGREVTELAVCYPEEYSNGFLHHFGTCQIPGGEYMPDVGKRAFDKLLELAKAHDGQTILIASHGATIRMLWSMLCDMPAERIDAELPYPTNASYSIAEYDGERIVPVEYSHDAHMPFVTRVHL